LRVRIVTVLALVAAASWRGEAANGREVRPDGGRLVVTRPGAAPVQACEPRPIVPPGEGFFADVSVEAGIKPAQPETGHRAHPRVAFADLNDDGFDDIVAHNMYPSVRNGTERFEHLVYLNRGDGTFADHSDASGLRDVQASFFAFGDVDNDGDTDVFAGLDIHDHPDGAETHKLLLNRGEGVFEVKANSGVERPVGMASGVPLYAAGNAVFADFDGDADLDLFVGNGNTGSVGYLVRNQYFVGGGDGTFTEATASLGGNRATLANGSMACDFDDDADLDIFVAVYGVSNGGAQNFLFVNDGSGRFADQAVGRGVASLPGGNYWRADLEHGRMKEPGKGPGEYIGGNGFGVDCPDIDNDGRIDILMAAISHPTEFPPGYNGWLQEEIDQLNYSRRWSDPSQILRNLGPDGEWAFENEWLDRGLPYNEGDIDAASADFDNDGRLDIAVSRDKKYEAGYNTYDQLGWLGLYHQQPDGRFTALGAASGINVATDPSGKQRMRGSGVVNWSDIDHDGDLDLLVGGGPDATSGHLFRNDIGSRNDWLGVRVEGDGASVNRDGVGTRVTVRRGSTRLTREVKASRGTYNAADSRDALFGLGDMPCDFVLEVRWPGGQEHVYDAAIVGRNRYVTVRSNGEIEVPGTPPRTPEPTPSPTSTVEYPTVGPEPTGTPEPSETPGSPRAPVWLPIALRGAAL
jgi:hypothetical protein